MIEAEIKAALTDVQALGCTLVAEAGGDWREGHSSVEERLAVGCTIRNRVRAASRRKTYRDVVLAPLQFSCWNPGPDANHQRLMQLAAKLVAGEPVTDPLVIESLWLAEGIIQHLVQDRVGGANHYYAPKAMKPAGAKPFWVFLNGHDGPEHPVAAAVGDQLFYRL